jgi:hypothetical protein
VAFLTVDVVEEGGRIGVWRLKNDHDTKLHGAVLSSLCERGPAESPGSLINGDSNKTHNWWLTADGVEVATEITKRLEDG